MAIKEPTCRQALLLPLLGLLAAAPWGLARGCVCPGATVVTRLPAETPGGVCCLNYSGSDLGRVSWPGFGGINDNNNNNHNNVSRPGLEVLDLSRCNISHIELSFSGATAHLREVHLQHNSLEALPEDFLARHPRLRVLDLGWNRLLELPEGLLRDSEELRRLGLAGNRLRSLEPVAPLLRGLSSLELDHNPWDCSCGLVELLAVATATEVNGTGGGGGGGGGGAGNLTCASPRKLEGVDVRSLTPPAVCQPAGLTALFILLPLLLLGVLLLCWCCGRKRRRRGDATFGSKKRKSARPRKRAQPVANGDPALTGGPSERGGGTPKNPAPALLSGTGDLREEAEAEPKPGSASSRDSRTSVAEGGGSGPEPPGNTAAGGGGDGEGGGDQGAELDDAVSVSEVLKDSANREKAYLAQSTEYYSLLPGMDLGGSDQGDYESVDLT